LCSRQEILPVVLHDAIHLAGQHEAARGGAGGRVDDGAFEGLFQGDDFEVFDRILSGVSLHHGRGQVPVGLLLGVQRPVHIGAVDMLDHFGKIALPVPELQALVDHRTEVQVGVAGARNRFDAMSTAPTTVSVSRPHPLSGDLHFTGSIIRLTLFIYRKES
jgi:hypothetical protein